MTSTEHDSAKRDPRLAELELAKAEALKARLELEQTNRELEQAIERANQMAVAAEIASAAKTDFLAKMSHEIRTPMNAIVGMIELTLDTELTAEQTDCLETARSAADALLCLINDILDFSKIEAGRLELSPANFNLRDTLHQAINPIAVRAHSKGLELACHAAPDVPDLLVGDAERLCQIVINLVGNAIKFTESGEVIISVTSEHADEDNVVLHFTVSDTGMGIKPEKLEIIFDAFAQADGSITRKHGGTGLGLAISRQLAELMNGWLWAESKVGKGSSFHFTARFGRQKANDARDKSLTPELHELPVLVVDDNATSRLILTEMLAGWSMRPTTVANGPAALAAMRKARADGKPFDLLLLDGCMPGMTGFDVAEAIAEDPDLAAKIILLTRAGDRLASERWPELGITSHLVKPVRQSDVFNAIVNVITDADMPADHHQAAKHEQPNFDRPLNILLAEDNPVNQKVASRLLGKWGHEVTIVGDGYGAIKAMANDDFDVILMDIQMPGLDGLQTTTRIRRQELATGGHIPIIAVTAHATRRDKDICLETGMDAYVSKPISRQALSDALHEIAATPARKQPPARPEPATPAISSQADEAPAFDMEKVLQRLCGDRDLLVEVAALFLETSPQLFASTADALNRGDLHTLSRSAHTLKGSLGNFAADHAYELAVALEQAANAGEITDAQKAWSDLTVEADRLRRALQQLVAESVPENA